MELNVDGGGEGGAVTVVFATATCKTINTFLIRSGSSEIQAADSTLTCYKLPLLYGIQHTI